MIEYDPYRWRSHIFDIKGSMVREILQRVVLCTAWSAAVVACHRYVRAVDIPNLAHTLIGVALGLLLVFRTNSSYERFMEGRRLWGSIINESRNLARASRVYLGDDPRLARSIAPWVAAFAYATMNRLRGEPGMCPFGGRLPGDEAEAVQRAGHVPLAVATRISLILAEARARGLISDYVQVELDRNVQLLIDYLGGCERIRKTPLPYVYVVHLRRSLILYCLTLPFALVSSYGWFTIVAVLALSYIIFGIDEIGVEIENPFGRDANDLPLEQFCATIERDVDEVVGPAAEPAAVAPGGASTGA